MKFPQKLGKKSKWLGLILGLVILLIPALLLAKIDKDSQNNIFLPENTVYDNPFWAAGSNINLNSQMNDDVYLAGANIVVSGPIAGDLIAVGSNIVINSEIKGNLRVAGGTVSIRGKVGGNITVAGGMVTLEQSAEVGKNVILAAGNGEINNKINKNLYAAAGNLILNSEIAGNAYVTIDPEGSLILNPQTNILGNLEYTAGQTALIQPGAKVQTDEKFSQWQENVKKPINKGKGLLLTFWLAGLLGALIVGLILVYIFKDFIKKSQEQIESNILLTILRGLVYLIVTPIGLLLLLITIIGLPLALILAAIYLIILYVSKIIIGIYIGDKLLKKFNKKKVPQLVWSMVLGTSVIYLLFLIPYLGWFIRLAVVLWGLGALMAVVKKEINLENN